MFQLKKFSLGRGIINLSWTVTAPQVKVNTKRTNRPNPVMSKTERLDKMYNFIKDHGRATRYGLQVHFKWGDGIMERLHREFVLIYQNEIAWNSKRQEYYVLSNVQETLI